MIMIIRPIFCYLKAIIRSRGPVSCRGQTLVEYALVLAFISIVAVSILVNLASTLKATYTTIDSQVARAPGGVNYNPGG